MNKITKHKAKNMLPERASRNAHKHKYGGKATVNSDDNGRKKAAETIHSR